jgi:hypothetical protein
MKKILLIFTLLLPFLLSSQNNALHFKKAPGNTGSSVQVKKDVFDWSSFTAEAWIKPDALLDHQTIFSQWGSGSSRSFSVILYGTNVGDDDQHKTLEFSVATANRSEKFFSSASMPISADVWQHVAFTYDATTGIMNTYINGLAAGSKILSGGGSMNNPARDLEIGARNSALPFGGAMDEVRFWRRALTGNEIRAQRGFSLFSNNKTDLVAYYEMNEGTADGDNTAITTITDSGPLQTVATLKNFTKIDGNSTSNFIAGATLETAEETPTLTTADATNATAISATFSSRILNVGTSAIIKHGFVYSSTNSNPQIGGTDTEKINTSTSAVFTEDITGLTPNSSYNYRAYATNGSGTGYGEVKLLNPQNSLHFAKISGSEGDKIIIDHNKNNSAFAWTSFTAEAWIKPDNSEDGNQTIFSQWKIIANPNTLTTEKAFSLILQPAGTLEFTMQNEEKKQEKLISTGTISSSTWQHVAITYNATDNVMTIYINGVSAGAKTGRGKNMQVPDSQAIEIGARSGNHFFGGAIDEVRFWKRALTVTEINAQKDGNLSSTNRTGLAAYYQMNQGTPGQPNTNVSTLTDSGPNKKDGQLNGFVKTGTSGNFIAGVENAVPPTVVTIAATSVIENAAVLGGNVTSTSDFSAKITERGFYYSVSNTNPKDGGNNVIKEANGTGVGSFTKNLQNLAATQKYYYTAYATNKGGTSYGSSLSFTTIAQRPTPTLTFTDFSKEYGSANFDLAASSTNTAGVFNYSIVTGVGGGTGTATLSGDNNKTVTVGKIGTVKIKVTSPIDANYLGAEKIITLTITKKAITITADVKSKVYGTTADPTFTYQVTTGGSFKTGDILTGSLSRAAGENAGAYAIASSLANANYNITFVPKNLTITKKPVTVTAVAISKVYGTTADPTLTYTGTLLGTDAFTGSLSRATGQNAGTYLIGVNTLANANYTITFVPANLTITKKAVTVTAVSISKVYGATDPTLTYTGGTLLGTYKFTGSLSRTTGENVGTYAIASSLVNANYDITFGPKD